MVTFVTRKEAGLVPPKSHSHALYPEGVAVHHVGAGSYANDDHARCLYLWKTIQRMHLNNTSEGYVDVAYNIGACHHGYLFEGRSQQGHAKVRPGSNGTSAANSRYPSVCAFWGLADGTPTAAIINAVGAGVAWLRKETGAPSDVKGHRDLSQTSCPGTLYGSLDDIARVADGGAIVDPKPKPKPPPPPPPPTTKLPTVGDNKVWPDYVAWGQKDSDSVRCYQHSLISKGFGIPAGATGYFGQQTIAATKAFQKNGNGLVGPNTAKDVLSGTPYALQSDFGRDVRKWNNGEVWTGWTVYGNTDSDSVRNTQQRLIDLGFSIPAGPTGNYYGQTKAAVAAFQKAMGLRVTGVCDSFTLRALFVAPKQHYTIKFGK